MTLTPEQNEALCAAVCRVLDREFPGRGWRVERDENGEPASSPVRDYDDNAERPADA